MKTQISGMRWLYDHSSFDRFYGHHRVGVIRRRSGIGFAILIDIEYLIDNFFPLIEQIKHGEIVEAASGIHPEIHFSR